LAVRENITDVLSNYPKGLHVNELSKIINIEPKKLVRVMRLLATRGCYNEGQFHHLPSPIPSQNLPVDVDVFANNRLSMILHSENNVRHMVNLHVESCAKGAAVLYDTLKDARTAYSYEPTDSPLMFANNKEGIYGEFFDFMRQDVRL